jgi:hypothetical protein
MPFNSKELARCCNSMAWDPHVYRLSLSGPWVNGKRLRCHLEDVYAKSDLFAVGRMAYDALLSEAESKAFPSASVPKPTYEDDEVLTTSSTYCFGGVSALAMLGPGVPVLLVLVAQCLPNMLLKSRVWCQCADRT